jgi:hypothetical protein
MDDKPHPNYYVPCKKNYITIWYFLRKLNNDNNNNNNKEIISGLQTLQLNAVFLNFNSWRQQL